MEKIVQQPPFTILIEPTEGCNLCLLYTSNIRTVIERQVIYKVPKVQFYGIMGTSVDLRTNKIQFGVDLRQKYMIGVSGIRLDDKYGYRCV